MNLKEMHDAVVMSKVILLGSPTINKTIIIFIILFTGIFIVSVLLIKSNYFLGAFCLN